MKVSHAKSHSLIVEKFPSVAPWCHRDASQKVFSSLMSRTICTRERVEKMSLEIQNGLVGVIQQDGILLTRLAGSQHGVNK
jgi:hypothetical protein